MGDGGLRAVFSDGTVTSPAWSHLTIHYGPVNLPACLPGADLPVQGVQRTRGIVQNRVLLLKTTRCEGFIYLPIYNYTN